ncbi:MAG: DUF58 domain-containing protein [Myxococcales bacterium]|nr:DUF58 domain-containing protein [Myxococcales bacterium]
MDSVRSGHVDVRLNRLGIYFLVLIGTSTLCGALLARPVVLAWAGLCLAGFIFAWFLAQLAGQRIANGALTARCADVEGDSKVHIAGERLFLPVFIRNTLSQPLVTVAVRLIGSSALEPIQSAYVTNVLGPTTTHTVTFPVWARMAGPWRIFGLAISVGAPSILFDLHVYLPAERAIKVLPRRWPGTMRAVHASRRQALRSSLVGRASAQRGFGLELKEVREFIAGDPFKHIAWKASARAGKLLVREFESDVTLSAYIVVDISPSMRWGEGGNALINRALDIAYGFGHTLAEHRDRFGSALCDVGVLAFVEPTSGPRALNALVEQLIEANAIVDDHLTAVTDDEVILLVAQHAFSQFGRDFRLVSAHGGSFSGLSSWDIHTSAMLEWVESRLEQDARDVNASQWLLSRRLSRDPMTNTFRLWARLRSIELPYRTEVLPGGKENGLCAVMDRILRAGGGPHSILLLTDLEGIIDGDALIRSVRNLRSRRHEVTFVLLRDRNRSESGGGVNPLEKPPIPPMQSTLEALFRLESDLLVNDLRSRLVTSGARLLPVVVPNRIFFNPEQRASHDTPYAP